MKMPGYHPLSTEDLPKEFQPLKRMLDHINKTLSDHSNALHRRLNFADNFDSDVRELEVFDGVEVEVALQGLRGRPIGVIMLWSDYPDQYILNWNNSDAKKIKLTVSWEIPPVDLVKIRILTIGG